MNQSTLTLESLALPVELLWTAKMEPISPVSSELFSINDLNDNWLCDYNFATGLPSLLDDADSLESKEIIEVTHDLTNGDDVVMELYNLKEEYLVDAKILDYPVGTDLAQPYGITKVVTPINSGYLNQFSFDVASLAQLTPPQSPPRNSAASSPTYQQPSHIQEYRNNFDGAFTRILSPEPQSPERIAISPTKFLNNPSTTTVSNDVPNQFTFSWPTTQPETVAAEPHVPTNLPSDTSVHQHEDYERDLQLLDEIVNTRVKELTEWNPTDESETQSSFSGPSLAGSVISDDDWQPESCYSSSVSSPLYQHSSDEQNNLSADPLQTSASDSLSSFTKKRTRQYGRGVEDRKIRKKEQNKNAATRYRQKKKVEMESVLIEEQKLINRNTELKRILAEAKREASYLKSLIREFNQNNKNL